MIAQCCLQLRQQLYHHQHHQCENSNGNCNVLLNAKPFQTASHPTEYYSINSIDRNSRCLINNPVSPSVGLVFIFKQEGNLQWAAHANTVKACTQANYKG